MRRGPADAAPGRWSAGARPAATRGPRSRSMKNLRRRVARRGFELRRGRRGVVHDRSEERRVGKSVDLGGRRIIKKKTSGQSNRETESDRYMNKRRNGGHK